MKSLTIIFLASTTLTIGFYPQKAENINHRVLVSMNTKSMKDKSNHGPVRILPLGDSITQADKSHNSYRRPLWHMLKESGYDIDFVGSLTKNHLGGPPNPDFDLNHEGHWGWRADEIIKGRFFRGRLSKWLKKYTPDIVLMHLGTNDVLQGKSISSTLDELQLIIDILRVENPNVTILIAKLIPLYDPAGNILINRLNEEIPRLVSVKDSPESRVLAVDHNSNFDAKEDTYDGAHPNPVGEMKMAQKWFDIIESL